MMKSTLLFSKWNFALLALIIVLGSCSKSNQTAFHKRKYQPFFAKAKGAKLDKPKELELVARESFEVASKQTTKVENTSADQSETQPSQVAAESMQKPSIKTKLMLKSLSKKLNTEVENPISESTLSDYKGIEQDVNSETLPVSIDSDEMLVLMLILSIIPPLAVFLLFGFKLEFWLSLLLTIILWLPGFIYAVYLVLKEAGKI
jgi:uncharacterized membrane protein YqaE (UPF0057 family)